MDEVWLGPVLKKKNCIKLILRTNLMLILGNNKAYRNKLNTLIRTTEKKYYEEKFMEALMI